MPGYYPQFSVAYIDVNGYEFPLPNEDINVYNVTKATAESDLTSDASGVVAEGSLAGASAGDIIELSHDTFTGTARFTLGTDQAEAYNIPGNNMLTFILQDEQTDTEFATAADIYVLDTDEPDVPPQLLGTVEAGDIGAFPFQTQFTKTMRVFAVAKSDSFVKTENAFNDENGTLVTIPATLSHGLFYAHYANATTTGTGKKTLYTDTIPAGTWSDDGDTLECEYAGYFAANGNSKTIIVEIAGTEVASIAVTENGTKWSIEIEAMRQFNSVLRVVGTLSYGTAGKVTVVNIDVTGLDLDNNDYDVLLRGLTSSGAGDLTATMGYGKFWQAPPPIPEIVPALSMIVDSEGYAIVDSAGYALADVV